MWIVNDTNEWMAGNKSWMRAGPNSQAHWIKLTGSYFTAACAHIIRREGAERIKIEKAGLASAPGKFIYRMDAEVCPECQKIAIKQS